MQVKLKHAILALASAGLFTTQTYAMEAHEHKPHTQPVAEFNDIEIRGMFDASDKPLELAALSGTEMLETDGALLWFTPIVLNVGRIAAVKIAHHSAHHTFGSLGRLPHIQLNAWRPGISGSTSALRIPLPNTPFFRP